MGHESLYSPSPIPDRIFHNFRDTIFDDWRFFSFINFVNSLSKTVKSSVGCPPPRGKKAAILLLPLLFRYNKKSGQNYPLDISPMGEFQNCSASEPVEQRF